jgi:prepilin-type N-terminal cleavage/methylation domain-containing protein
MTRWSRRRLGEHGLSLVELLVTMALMGVVASLTASTVIGVNSNLTKNRNREDSLRIASVAMESMSKSLRSATPLDVAGTPPSRLPAFSQALDKEMTFYTSLSGPLRRVHYLIDASGNLVEQTALARAGSAPYWDFTGQPTSSRVIGSKVPAAAAALFVYKDDTGAVIPAPGTDATALTQVRSVDVTLTVQADSRSRVKPVVLTTRVSLPAYYVVSRS